MAVRLGWTDCHTFVSYFSGFSSVCHSPCVWPTARKLGCITYFNMLLLVMGFISSVHEIDANQQLLVLQKVFGSMAAGRKLHKIRSVSIFKAVDIAKCYYLWEKKTICARFCVRPSTKSRRSFQKSQFAKQFRCTILCSVSLKTGTFISLGYAVVRDVLCFLCLAKL